MVEYTGTNPVIQWLLLTGNRLAVLASSSRDVRPDPLFERMVPAQSSDS